MIHPNTFKYLTPPTIQQIDAVVKKKGITAAQFERFNGIAKDTIKRVRMNIRPMPAKHWHLFFEPTHNHGSFNGSKATPKAATNKRTKIKPVGNLANLV